MFNPYFLTLTDFLTVFVEYLAEYVTFLPTLSFLSTFFLTVTLATPFLLVLALKVLPLNLKTICFLLAAFPLIFKVACKTNFLADFLTLTDFKASLITSAFLFTLNVAVFWDALKISLAAKVATALYVPTPKPEILKLPAPFLTLTLYVLEAILTVTVPVKVLLVVILTTAFAPWVMLATLIVNAGSTGFTLTTAVLITSPDSYKSLSFKVVVTV